MRSSVVVVADKAPVLLEQVRLHFVRFMERLNLAAGCWPSHAGSDVFDAKVLAMQVKL